MRLAASSFGTPPVAPRSWTLSHWDRMMAAEEVFTIGELASRTGLTPDALRYYERRGVMAPARRTHGGFRLYTNDAIARVQFIKQAQTHGLTLAEIRELLRLDGRRGATHCRRVQQLLERKLRDIDVRLAELRAFRRSLEDHLARCRRALAESPDADCPIVIDFQGKRT